ncbi:MAG: hypothetical protein A3F11_11300 [Gammaproteobacteria bacterium RIFCSPHIGHO2_12_FULL_37_14]|nr:MAG: hypothetical protein A3F11_11300 [Gammaproteobacteria bacterium RIFCSPHIGHO2_12_FULL_37_14]
MFNENFDQWYKTKNPFTSSNEWSKQITEICHICQHMTQKNFELANENVFRLSDQFKRLTEVKKPEELLHLQRDFINENMNACMQGMQTFITSCTECIDEGMKMSKPLYTATGVFGAARGETNPSRSYEKHEKSSK